MKIIKKPHIAVSNIKLYRLHIKIRLNPHLIKLIKELPWVITATDNRTYASERSKGVINSGLLKKVTEMLFASLKAKSFKTLKLHNTEQQKALRY